MSATSNVSFDQQEKSQEKEDHLIRSTKKIKSIDLMGETEMDIPAEDPSIHTSTALSQASSPKLLSTPIEGPKIKSFKEALAAPKSKDFYFDDLTDTINSEDEDEDGDTTIQDGLLTQRTDGQPGVEDGAKDFGPWMLVQKKTRRPNAHKKAQFYETRPHRNKFAELGSSSLQEEELTRGKKTTRSGHEKEASQSTPTFKPILHTLKSPSPSTGPETPSIMLSPELHANSLTITNPSATSSQGIGGIWLLWDTAHVNVRTSSVSNQYIHATIHKEDYEEWVLSAVYASPNPTTREALWEELEMTASNINQPWLVAGDFNDFTDHTERRSFTPTHNFTRAQRFRERINNCNLMDLGSVGPRLTWTNNRQGLANTMERLDRAMSNAQWRTLFPEGTVRTLPRTYSDHSPLVVLTQDLDPPPTPDHYPLSLPSPFTTAARSRERIERESMVKDERQRDYGDHGLGSFALHQACSKVVPAIARYGIDPTTPQDKKMHIIHSLCKPLSDSILASQESLSSGSALCLKALVDSDNWRFASADIVNEVCQRVAGALDNPTQTQTNSHMALVMALAKHNNLIVEAYARLLIRSGLRILNAGVAEGNSQKRLSAIQMVNFLMKCLDPKSLFSELGLIIEEMDKCQSDPMAYVRGAAFEALQTARRIAMATEKGLKIDRDMMMGSSTGSSFGRRGNNSRRRNLLSSAGDQSPVAASPESQTVDSFVGYDSLIESPISNCQASGELSYDHDRRSVNRKLWRRYENGGVDVSLKDGLYSEVTRGSATQSPKGDGSFNSEGDDYTDGFAGFLQGSTRRDSVPRSTTPSPQRARYQINVDNVKIFETPRKLIHSLQDPNNERANFSGKHSRMFRSPSSSKFEWSPTSKYDQNGLSPNINYVVEKDGELHVGNEQFQGGSESVSSTEDIPINADLQVAEKVVPGSEVESLNFDNQKNNCKSAISMVCGVFVMLFAVFISLLWIDGQDESYNLVPT
ncbi:Protein SINE1 [Camellia lanceoleosa]|uniref:Protein SINE1 n=1 Tax=Camellia lanceoleosa TaxID=1840588 RepID=A0ACC0FRF5_9ERIC|nr:Protein SINE1 [Camellia lanceoleosa]